ncbi:MAG: hypothetical protein WCW78_03110 [Candidatus Paceibacterota bacterium]|jgi:hypothetical protein
MRKSLSFIISAIVIIGFGIMAYTQWKSTSTVPVTSEVSVATSTKPAEVAPRPIATITSVILGKTVNVDGSVESPTQTFGVKDPIYAGLSLQNAYARTQISYIRTFNGKYVDSKVSHPTKDGTTNFYFSWVVNTGKVRTVGSYSLMFYIDGVKSQTVNYIVK